MMTLIGFAITIAYGYSAAIVLGLRGEDFFWELATLIDIMLLGHWIEMKSVLGASAALESLVRLRAFGENRASARRRVQPQGGAREPGARRTSCTLSVRPRAPTKRMGPYRHARSLSE